MLTTMPRSLGCIIAELWSGMGPQTSGRAWPKLFRDSSGGTDRCDYSCIAALNRLKASKILIKPPKHKKLKVSSRLNPSTDYAIPNTRASS